MRITVNGVRSMLAQVLEKMDSVGSVAGER